MSKVMAILSNLALFTMPAHQIWSCHVTQEANFENFLCCPNSKFNIIKVTKILAEKLSTSEAIRLKPHGGNTPPSPPPPVPGILGKAV